jgi:hypothetical protein
MGYYTRYSLETNPVNSAAMAAASEMVNGYYFDPSGIAQEPGKWYEHQEEMLELSKRFPKTLFTLHGEGEGAGGDIWNKYFRNGKVQVEQGEIVIGKFDPKKLK